MEIAIVDCGIGNIRSVHRMFEAIGVDASVVSKPEDALSCQRLVLPGVGAFDAGMRAIHERGWHEMLNHLALSRRVPLLGICLGMQLLCRRSDEGLLPGLGWIAADVIAFQRSQLNLKIPHMGWNNIRTTQDNQLIPIDIEEQRFYHVHKYHVVCDSDASVLGVTHYGYDFATIIHRANIYGVQFHPEKSHKFGMNLLRRFSQIKC
jgi:imidazole glycerol-phosphate synthase subunit HisH